MPEARRCTPVAGGDVDTLELDVPELDKLFCLLSALTLADAEGLLVSEGACALGVSGICSESWSSFGDGSSTLVGGETGAFDISEFSEAGCDAAGNDCVGLTPVALATGALIGAAALAVSGSVGVAARGITGEVGEVVGASCATGVLVVGAWVRARSAGSGESKRGELDVGALVAGVLVTGVLVTGALAIGVLVTGVLVVGAWVRARSAGSGESKRGELEVGALGPGALATGPIVRDRVMDVAAPVGAVVF
ncbi:MAG: hypothetical protein WCJ73_01730 [Actinomycetes bacterium]